MIDNLNDITKMNTQLSLELKEPNFTISTLFSQLETTNSYYNNILSKTKKLIEKQLAKSQTSTLHLEIKNSTLLLYDINNYLVNKILRLIIRNEKSKQYFSPNISELNLSISTPFQNKDLIMLFAFLILYINKQLQIKKLTITNLFIKDKLIEHIISSFIEYSMHLESLIVKTNLNDLYTIINKKASLQKIKLCNLNIHISKLSKAFMNLNNIKSISFVDVIFNNDIQDIEYLIIHLIQSPHFHKFKFTHLIKYIKSTTNENINQTLLNHFAQLIPYTNTFIIHDINTQITNETISTNELYDNLISNKEHHHIINDNKSKFVLNGMISSFSKYKHFHFERFNLIDIGPMDQLSFACLIEHLQVGNYINIKELIIRFDINIFEYDVQELFCLLKDLKVKVVKIFNFVIPDKDTLNIITEYLYSNKYIKCFSMCPYHAYNFPNDENKQIMSLNELVDIRQIPFSYKFDINKYLITLYAFKNAKLMKSIYNTNTTKLKIFQFLLDKEDKMIYIENKTRIIYHKFNLKTYNFES